MAEWSWEKLRHENYGGRVHYGDCQVVSAVNAYHVLTGKMAYQNEEQYRNLCKLAKAQYGAAICIEKVYKKLGLEFGGTSFYVFQTRKSRVVYPIECRIWHKRYGFHSILIVDRAAKCGAVRVTNFQYETSTGGWMFEEDLNHFLEVKNPSDSGEERYRCRKFRMASRS